MSADLKAMERELRLAGVLAFGSKAHKAYVLKMVPSEAIIHIRPVWDILSKMVLGDRDIDISIIPATAGRNLPDDQAAYLESLANFTIIDSDGVVKDITTAILSDYHRSEIANRFKDIWRDLAEEQSTPDEALGQSYLACQELSTMMNRRDDGIGFGKGISHEEIMRFLHSEETLLVPTGFTGFDERVGGFQPGDMVVIAAPSNQGKTTVMIQMALNMSKKVPVLFQSLELDKGQVYRRCLANLAQVPFSQLRSSKKWDDEIRETIVETIKGASEDRSRKDSIFWVKNTPNLKVIDILSDVMVGGYKVVFIDYLNMMTGGGADESLWQQLGDIARELKILAMDQKIVVVVAAQYDEKQQQIRYSRAVREHCDIMLTWVLQSEGDATDEEEGIYDPIQTFDCQIDKGRNIEKFQFPLRADFSIMRVTDCGESRLGDADEKVTTRSPLARYGGQKGKRKEGDTEGVVFPEID